MNVQLNAKDTDSSTSNSGRTSVTNIKDWQMTNGLTVYEMRGRHDVEYREQRLLGYDAV